MRKSKSYGLPGYRGLTGRGIQDNHENNRFLKAFDLVPHDKLLTKVAEIGVDFECSLKAKEISHRTFAER